MLPQHNLNINLNVLYFIFVYVGLNFFQPNISLMVYSIPCCVMDPKMRINQRVIHLFLLLVLFYLFVLQIRAIWPFTIDDMYITLRYAQNWSEGHGLVWNVGEPVVEGYSNFSFVVLARVAISWGLDPVVVLKAMGIIGLFFTCMAVYAITRLWFSRRLALIPCFWLLAYKGQILWSVSGLEVAVYQALICFAVYFIFRGLGYSRVLTVSFERKTHNKRRPFCFIAAGILLALAGMTRPEAPALMILFVSLLLLLNRRASLANNYWRSVALFCGAIVVCFAPYFFWRWHYYGRLFPNPVYCKGLISAFTFNLDKHYLHLIWPFAILALPTLWQAKDYRHLFLMLPSVLYLGLLIGADPIVAFDNRLFLPAFALCLPVAVKGLSVLLNQYLQKYDGIFDVVMYLLASLFAFFFIPMMSLTGYHHFTENPVAGALLRQNVVAWLENHTKPGSHVVLADSGLIPFQSRRQFIDSYCLNNAEMTKFPMARMYNNFCESVFKTRPDVIILTALIEDGKIIYTPTDVCLAEKLAHNNDYCPQISLGSGDSHSFYRYEIFKICQTS